MKWNITRIAYALLSIASIIAAAAANARWENVRWG